jgi:Tfp pilus assembly protein FimV
MSRLCYYAGMNKEKHRIQIDQQNEPEYRIKLKATHRGKTVLSTLAAVGIFMSGAAVGGNIVHTIDQENTLPELSGETVTVNQGDTLWDIAGELSPKQDPRDVVHELLRANPGVSPDSIEPGQVLQIPLDIAEYMKNPEK